jgi:branched-chain amino acid transport system substrate-binding protein
LTQSTPAVSGAPGIYVETTGGSRYFARLVPTTAREAKALVAAAAAQNVTKLFVASDGLSYGAALAYAVKHSASGAVTVVEGDPTAAAFASSGANGLLYATANPGAAQKLYDAVAARQPSATLLASSALADQQFASSLSAAAQRHLNISSPGFDNAHLTATGQQFTRAFTAAYGHAPAPEAIFGYEAMSALITTLSKAGSNASNRTTVRTDFFAIHNRSSVLGSYSIDANGDTNIAPFVISHVTAGRLTPYRFVSEQG